MPRFEFEKSRLQKHFYFATLDPYFIPVQDNDSQRIFTVQDKKATSNEYYVAKALTRANLEFDFQLAVSGGKVAFGMVLDFLVYTVPLPTPLWVHGEHWHMGDRRAKDLRQMQQIGELLGMQVAEPKEIWGTQSNNEEDAYKAVRMIFL